MFWFLSDWGNFIGSWCISSITVNPLLLYLVSLWPQIPQIKEKDSYLGWIRNICSLFVRKEVRSSQDIMKIECKSTTHPPNDYSYLLQRCHGCVVVMLWLSCGTSQEFLYSGMRPLRSPGIIPDTTTTLKWEYHNRFYLGNLWANF